MEQVFRCGVGINVTSGRAGKADLGEFADNNLCYFLLFFERKGRGVWP
jgi:hypothetical protein